MMGMPPYPPRTLGRHRVAGIILSAIALVLLFLDQFALAVVLLVPIYLLGRTVDRLDRPVEEEMTDALLKRAWVMTPADRSAAFERWSARFGAVRDRDEVRSALEAMPGGMAREEKRRWISGGGLAGAAGFVFGALLFVTGLASFAVGRPAPASVFATAGGLLLAVISLTASRKSPARPRAPQAGGGTSESSRGLRKRGSAITLGAVVGVVVVSFAGQKLGLAGSVDGTVLPPMPVAPEGVVEYRGTTSNGMPMVIWRWPDSVFIRVDSAESACGIGANFAGHRFKMPERRRFAGRWTYETTASFAPEGRLFGPREEVLPKRVDAQAYGRFLPGGRVVGGFTRRDVIRDGEETVLDCTRSVDWTAQAT
jgi:hypothetical protein